MAEHHLSLGIEAARRGDLEKARGYLAQAVKENPKSEEGWLWLGRCLTDPEQRRYCYQRVLRLNPQNTAAQKGLAQISLPEVTESPRTPSPALPETSNPPAKQPKKKTDWKWTEP